MSKMSNSTANLSDRLKDMLFNKRDEGYYFRKFQREKILEGQGSAPVEKIEEPQLIKTQRSASSQNIDSHRKII